ncbi:MAG: CerR family C-terminal domain-containing protein [Proteobacteria bacterium]|nr:CerR family C-terminal domain-containing protein [Pseudomonadota bacterium]MBU1611508.1 CerR family C-terminal domain-containing protein [Pseudomonadota bacterium]
MKKPNEIDTKERLLIAAVDVFGAKGFQSATVREICQAADVNVAAVNYHFGDKEQLYATVLRYIFDHYESRRDPELSAIANSGATPEERLRAHIKVGVKQTYDMDCDNCGKCDGTGKDECAPYSIFLMEMAHPSPYLDEVVQTYIKPDSDQLLDILTDYFEGKASPELIGHCANSVWGQILHQAMCWPIDVRLHGLEAAINIAPDALAEHIFQLTLGGLRLYKEQLESNTI